MADPREASWQASKPDTITVKGGGSNTGIAKPLAVVTAISKGAKGA
jgi:hypothetical protein